MVRITKAARKMLVLNHGVFIADENQPSYVRYGVREVVKYLEEITGRKIPVRTTPDEKARMLIVIGEKAVRQMAPGVLSEKAENLGEEGFVIKSFVNRGKPCLIVTGAGPRGTKFALLDLMKMIQREGKTAYLAGQVNLTNSPGFSLRGMHLNGWPINYPYTFRCWQEEDWRRYIDILAYQGVNLFYIWPFMEIMPVPLSEEDEAYLREVRRVVDYAKKQRGMEVWIMQSANRVALNDCGVLNPRVRPYWIGKSQSDMNPAAPEQFKAIVKSHEALYRIVNNADGCCIIDSDPGGWRDSPLGDFMKIFQATRKILDRHTINGTQTKLINWMHTGWGQYPFWWMPDWNERESQKFIRKTIRAMKNDLPEPWWLIAGYKSYLPPCQEENVLTKTVFMPYGIIEMEPSLPTTQNDLSRVRGIFDLTAEYPQIGGVMGNVQTPLLQFPHVYYFLATAWDYEYRKRNSKDILSDVAKGLYPEHTELVADCFAALGAGVKHKNIGILINELEKLDRQDNWGRPGILGRKLFPDHRQIAGDLILQLKVKAAFEELHQTVTLAKEKETCEEPVEKYLEAVLAWEERHGWGAYWIRLNAAEARGGNIMPFDPRWLQAVSTLREVLGGMAIDDAAVDTFLLPIGERLACRYPRNVVTKCCIEPMRQALLEV